MWTRNGSIASIKTASWNNNGAIHYMSEAWMLMLFGHLENLKTFRVFVDIVFFLSLFSRSHANGVCWEGKHTPGLKTDLSVLVRTGKTEIFVNANVNNCVSVLSWIFCWIEASIILLTPHLDARNIPQKCCCTWHPVDLPLERLDITFKRNTEP